MSEIDSHHGTFRHATLHVQDTGGSGRPVVLIHGWPLSGESWSAQVPALTEAGYRVITYDRRGFGRSEKTGKDYDYDTLTEDLQSVLEELDLRDVTLVGFSMGGGEVARYVATYGPERIHSVVFAAAVPPYLLKSADNPEGPLTEDQAQEWTAAINEDMGAFFDQFVVQFFSANGVLKVSEGEKQAARAQCDQADKTAVLGCMSAFGTTDFREDLTKITVPTLVIHGDADGTVPFEGSGKRTHEAIAGSELVLLPDAPHGCNVSDKAEFNRALIDFLSK